MGQRRDQLESCRLIRQYLEAIKHARNFEDLKAAMVAHGERLLELGDPQGLTAPPQDPT